MKLQVLHGPGIISSRQKLVSSKTKFSDNVIVFEKGSDPLTILGAINTSSLFNEEQLIILENPPEDFVLNSSLHTSNSSLILWFDHEVSEKKPILAWAKKEKGDILFFPEAKEISIFPFLDLLGNRDKKAFLELEKLKKFGIDNQYIITMAFWLLRNLVATPKNAKDFVRRKNEKMRANFKDLSRLYKAIIEIDFKIKLGLLDPNQASYQLVNKFFSEA